MFPLLFLDDPEIIHMTAGLIFILAYILPFQTTQLVMAGSLRGAADTRYVAMTMLISVACIRPLLGYTLVNVVGLGLAGAWYAIFVDQVIRLLMLTTRFSRGKWIKAQMGNL
jgi:Na+-driven multidrug efflux pump